MALRQQSPLLIIVSIPLAHHINNLPQAHRAHKAIVYMLTCAAVDYYAAALRLLPGARGLAVTSLHGRMKQSHRDAALAAFAAQPAGVPNCTISYPLPNWQPCFFPWTETPRTFTSARAIYVVQSPVISEGTRHCRAQPCTDDSVQSLSEKKIVLFKASLFTVRA